MRYKKSSIIDDGCTKSLNFGVVSWHQTLIFKNKKTPEHGSKPAVVGPRRRCLGGARPA
jgi:hypothetical protein